jgi:hypothetical protein
VPLVRWWPAGAPMRRRHWGDKNQPPLSWRRSLGPGIVTYDGVRSMAEYRDRLYLGTASFADCAYVIQASFMAPRHRSR